MVGHQVSPWLNLDALGIADLGPRSEALMEQLCALTEQLYPVLDGCGALMATAKEAGARAAADVALALGVGLEDIEDVDDGISSLLARLSGSTDVWRLLHVLSAVVDPDEVVRRATPASDDGDAGH